MAAKQSVIPNARYHCRKKYLRAGANFSSRSDPQIVAALWGATIIKVPSATPTALTKKFIRRPALIHMLAHVKPFFGGGKHISFACNPDIQRGQKKNAHHQVGDQASHDDDGKRAL